MQQGVTRNKWFYYTKLLLTTLPTQILMHYAPSDSLIASTTDVLTRLRVKMYDVGHRLVFIFLFEEEILVI